MKGSKSKLAERIVSLFPRATHLYDLFCGGSAISHCALLKNKYQHIHINDINPMMPQAFIKALQGGFDDEDRWISREDFFRLKDTDPYVAICFSFGNDLKTYCYGKEVEPLKKALHYAIFFDSYELSDALIGVDLRPIRKCATRQEKYLLAKRLIKVAYSNNNTPPQCSKVGKDSGEYRLQSYESQKRTQEIAFQKKNSTRLDLQNLECLKRVQDSRWTRQDNCTFSSSHTRYCTDSKQLPPPLQRVELENQERLLRLTSISNPSKVCSLTWSIGDYQDVQIEDNSVIICDIPYIGTNEYVNGGDNFDHERFYEWCLKQKEPLYICSYEMPEKDFKVVAEFARVDTMSATNNGKLVSEKVFMPRTQETRGNIQLSLF